MNSLAYESTNYTPSALKEEAWSEAKEVGSSQAALFEFQQKRSLCKTFLQLSQYESIISIL